MDLSACEQEQNTALMSVPSAQPSIRKNFLWNALLMALWYGSSLITFPYVSRILGPAGNGKVGFASALVGWFDLVMQLGIPVYGVRVCAQARDDRAKLSKVTQELLLIMLCMCILTYTVFLGVVFFVPRMRPERTLYLIISTMIFANLIEMEWLYKGLEKYRYITIRSLLLRAIAVAGIFLFIHKPEDYVIYGGLSVFAVVVSGIWNFIHARHYIDLKPVGEYNCRQHLKPVLTFFAMSCATVIYTQLDTVMLGFMTDDAQVGYYSAGLRVKDLLVCVATSLGTVLMPRISWYVKEKLWTEMRRTVFKGVLCVFLLSTAMAVVFFLFARPLLLWYAGALYEPAILPLRVLLPTVVLFAMTNVIGFAILVPCGHEKAVLVSEITGAAVNLLLNAFLIPSYGATGAAIGTLAAESVVLIVLLAALQKVSQLREDGFCSEGITL